MVSTHGRLDLYRLTDLGIGNRMLMISFLLGETPPRKLHWSFVSDHRPCTFLWQIVHIRSGRVSLQWSIQFRKDVSSNYALGKISVSQMWEYEKLCFVLWNLSRIVLWDGMDNRWTVDKFSDLKGDRWPEVSHRRFDLRGSHVTCTGFMTIESGDVFLLVTQPWDVVSLSHQTHRGQNHIFRKIVPHTTIPYSDTVETWKRQWPLPQWWSCPLSIPGFDSTVMKSTLLNYTFNDTPSYSSTHGSRQVKFTDVFNDTNLENKARVDQSPVVQNSQQD